MTANNSNLRVYSLHISNLVPIDGLISRNWRIEDPNHNFKVRSISWDYRIDIDDVLLGGPVGKPDPVIVQLAIGRGINEQIHSAFSSLSAPIVPLADFNGMRIHIYEPKQLFFDSWFASNELYFLLEIFSNDLAQAYRVHTDLIVEIERL